MENKESLLCEKNIGGLIHKIGLCLRLDVLQSFKLNQCVVTPEQWGLLYTLYKEDGQHQRQLSKALLKDRPNITRMIDILEKKELLKRKVDEKNRRVFKVFLTDKGREITVKYSVLIKTAANNCYQGITEEEIDILKSILQKMYEYQIQNLKLQI